LFAGQAEELFLAGDDARELNDYTFLLISLFYSQAVFAVCAAFGIKF